MGMLLGSVVGQYIGHLESYQRKLEDCYWKDTAVGKPKVENVHMQF